MRGNTRTRGTAPHWKVLDDPQVESVARKVARSIADDNKGILEADDIYHEVLILIAGTPSLAERAIAREYGTLYHEVRMDVLDKFVRPLMRTGEMAQRKYRTVSTDKADDEPQRIVMFDDGTGDYTEDAVKLLLPAIWDESYAYSLPDRDDAPEKDMPKAASNKARSNNHWAYIADIKTGWAKTPLTLLEKRAIFMAYGLGWPQTEIAAHEGIAKQVVSTRVSNAIKKITARLNGARIIEEE